MPDASWPAYLWAIKAEVEFAAFVVLLCLSLVRGAAPERILSGTLVSMFLLDRVYHAIVGGSIIWRHANFGHVAIDVLVLAIAFVVALHANRVYPLWIAGAQIIAMSGHLYRLVLEEINRYAYDMMTITPSYIELVAMALGIGFHMSRRRKQGSYPSWRRSWPQRRVTAQRLSPGT